MSNFAGQLAFSKAALAGGSMAAALANAVLALPSVTRTAVFAVSASGSRTPGTVRVTSSALAGTWGANHDAQWFERVHVLPRRTDLGAINGERWITVEVWNAFRRSQTLTTVHVAGPSGVTIASGSLPRVFASYRIESFTIHVSPAGLQNISNVVSWVFSALAQAGIDHTITGLRVVLFTARPDGDAGVEELYGYETSVITAEDGSEQRVSLRSLPTRGVDLTAVFGSPAECATEVGKVFMNGGNVFIVPFWPDAVQLAVQANAGDSTIYLATSGRGFKNGGSAILWRDPATYEALSITSVQPDRLVLSSPTAAGWPAAGTIVMPLLPCRLRSEPSVDTSGAEASSARIEFDWEAA